MWLWCGLAMVLLSCSPSERRMRRNLMLAKHRPHPNGAKKIDFVRGFSERVETVFAPFSEKWFRPPTLVRLPPSQYPEGIRVGSAELRESTYIYFDLPGIPVRLHFAVLVGDGERLNIHVHACRELGEACERALALLDVTEAPPEGMEMEWDTGRVGIQQQLAAFAEEALVDHTVIHMTAYWTRADDSYWEFTLTPPDSN